MTLLMSAERAAQLGLEPMGIFRGFTVAGCEPDEMGIGPVFAIPAFLSARAWASTTLTSGSLTKPSRVSVSTLAITSVSTRTSTTSTAAPLPLATPLA